MAKIIKINQDIITVLLDNGMADDFPSSRFNFEINVDMEINTIKTSDGNYLFSCKNNPELSAIIYVNKYKYGAYSLFLGGLGVHEFYAGNHKKGGIILLVTVILLAVFFTDLFTHLDYYRSGYNIKNSELWWAIRIYVGYLFALNGIIAFCRKADAKDNITIRRW